MIEENISRTNDYFEEQIALCGQRGQALLAGGRADEATFEKVKANIYNIFRTVFSVAVTTCPSDARKIQSFFSERIQQIPSGWAVAQEKARAHGDSARVYLEQIKLDTAGDIRENFAHIWEGAE